MKNLFVIRHSKAMLYREGQEDHDRTLNKIGKINISIPEKVKVILNGSVINVEGPLGKKALI